eukprot:1232610-Pyramimonas_sp.AAC.1
MAARDSRAPPGHLRSRPSEPPGLGDHRTKRFLGCSEYSAVGLDPESRLYPARQPFGDKCCLAVV